MYGHVYTDEERAFMAAFVPGHSYKEIASAFTERFGWEISIGQINSYISNHHLNTGRTGQFEKGHVPANKGKRMGAAAYEKCAQTMFRKGNIPGNHKEVGSERISRDGYIEVKVAEPNMWKPKHRVVWERENGPVPKGCIIIFRDNDKTNTDIGNLLMVKRGIHAVMNHTGLCEYSGEFKDTAVKIAELKSVTSGIRKGRKNKT